MDILIGIDNSKNCPGIAVWRGNLETDEFSLDSIKAYALVRKGEGSSDGIFNVIRRPNYESNIQIFTDNAEQILKLANFNRGKEDCVFAAMEDYSFNSKGRSITVLAENAGILKNKLFYDIIWIRTYSPKLVKCFACPKGKGDKNSMHDALNEKWGFETKFKKGVSPLADMVDAIWILTLLYVELKSKRGMKLNENENKTVTKDLTQGCLKDREFEYYKN